MKLVLTIFSVLLITLTGKINAATGYKGFQSAEALITAQELKVMIDKKEPNLVIIAVAKATDYHMGHVPGAHRVWRDDYNAAEGIEYPYKGMVASQNNFERFARTLGISNNTTVVAYDHKYDSTLVGILPLRKARRSRP